MRRLAREAHLFLSRWFQRRRIEQPQHNIADSMQLVMVSARNHAIQVGAVRVGTEHMLLALLDHPDATVNAMIATMGITNAELRTKVEERFGPRDSGATSMDLLFGQRAKRAIALAIEFSRFRAHSSVGPGHLLMGIMRDRGRGAEALQYFGATDEVLFDALVKQTEG